MHTIRTFALTLLTVGLMSTGLQADNIYGLKTGNLQPGSVAAMVFGPDGILFIGDAKDARIHAVQTGDQKSATRLADIRIGDIAQILPQVLSVAADDLQGVTDLCVNPETGNVFLSVALKDGSHRIAKLDPSGRISELSLQNIPFASAALPNPAPDKVEQSRRGPRNNRDNAITDLAFLNGQVLVSGLSDQSSSVWSVMFPFDSIDQGTSLQIYHGAHGRSEDYAPIRTFLPMIIDGEPNLLAGYVCTPLVKFPLTELTSNTGGKVEGVTLAELGNRNQPLDMIHYHKDGQDFLLLANSNRGVMKISTENIGRNDGINEPVSGGGTAGQQYETISELDGVVQLDKLNDETAVVLIQTADGKLTLKSVKLP